jgi:glycine cleavage system H lipoate-binding protein
MEKDGLVKIGIDDFLQHVTGIITRVDIKKAGDKVKKGERLVTISQKGKQLNLYSPVTGTIQEINLDLVNDPSLLNSSPYGEGWIYRIEPSNWLREMSLLNMAGKYMKWLNDEMIKLKDFLAFPAQPQQLHYLSILQDGGLLKNHVLEDMGPEVWEEFQTRFLDVNR